MFRKCNSKQEFMKFNEFVGGCIASLKGDFTTK